MRRCFFAPRNTKRGINGRSFFGAGKGLKVISSPLEGQQAQCQAHRVDFPSPAAPSLCSGSDSKIPQPAGVPASLPGIPVVLRDEDAHLLPSSAGSHVPKAANKPVPILRRMLREHHAHRRYAGRVPCLLCLPRLLHFPARARLEDTQTRHGVSLHIRPPAFLPAEGNCSA